MSITDLIKGCGLTALAVATASFVVPAHAASIDSASSVELERPPVARERNARQGEVRRMGRVPPRRAPREDIQAPERRGERRNERSSDTRGDRRDIRRDRAASQGTSGQRREGRTERRNERREERRVDRRSGGFGSGSFRDAARAAREADPRQWRERREADTQRARERAERRGYRDGYNQRRYREGDRTGYRDNRRSYRDGYRAGRSSRYYDGRRWHDYRVWDRNDWRRHSRYDWYRHRATNRGLFSIGRYYSPYRSHRYRRIGIGYTLDNLFFGSRYWIDDPWRYRLPEVYGPYRWVRYYDDVLLVDIYNGDVVDVIYDFFW